MTTRLGVIGAGYISRFHFGAFAKFGTNVRRVADVNRAAAETAAADDFIAFLQTDAVKAIFEQYMFVIYE